MQTCDASIGMSKFEFKSLFTVPKIVYYCGNLALEAGMDKGSQPNSMRTPVMRQVYYKCRITYSKCLDQAKLKGKIGSSQKGTCGGSRQGGLARVLHMA